MAFHIKDFIVVTFKRTADSIVCQESDCLVFFLEQDFIFSKILTECADCFFPNLKELMKQRDFTGKALSSLFVPIPTEKKITNLLFLGLGNPKKGSKFLEIEMFRRALGKMIRVAESNKCKTISFEFPAKKLFGKTTEQLAQEVAIITQMASYQFDQFITDKKSRLLHDFEINFVATAKEGSAITRGTKYGTIIAQAVNKARSLIDAPPSQIIPKTFAQQAEKIAKQHKLKITIFDEKKVESLGMGGMTAVSKGSDEDCRFVIVEYKSTKKTAPTVGLVGKGITFDSGGLSLKPANYMDTMKEDMSGAATVIGTMQAIAQLKPSVNVVAIAALAENMPGAKAYKPGDILKFYNGKTAEILNTDAEGRLVLADALSYITKHFKLDALVDVATLTGACLYALGPFFCGLMSQHDALSKKLQDASARSGDRVWPLPFHDDYKPAIKSEVADIKNIGDKKYMAGTTTAGFFLQNFVGDVPWAHLDIAGTAFNVPDISYFRPGATGFGVRLFIDLLMNWK